MTRVPKRVCGNVPKVLPQFPFRFSKLNFVFFKVRTLLCGALQELKFDIRHAGALTLGRLGGALQELNFDIRYAGALALGRLSGALQELNFDI